MLMLEGTTEEETEFKGDYIAIFGVTQLVR